MVDLYKNVVRSIYQASRIYHHTPVVKGLNPSGWSVLELGSQDRTTAVAGLFRLSDPPESDYLLRFRGLDISKRYRVTFDNANETCELSGYTLIKEGVPIRLESALTSELILVQAMDS